MDFYALVQKAFLLALNRAVCFVFSTRIQMVKTQRFKTNLSFANFSV
jgi:hypothetical protein